MDVLGLVAALCAAASSQPLASATAAVGDVAVQWEARRGTTIAYRGTDAFLPYPDEFTFHDPAWKTTYYQTRRGSGRATVRKRGGARILDVSDNAQHFFYRKRITVLPGNRIIEEFEYRQKDLGAASLQLGWRPAVPWLDGADLAVVAGGERREGKLTRGYSGKRVLLDGITEAEFRSVFGTLRIKSTHPMILYDYRNRGQFWLGWDVPLEKGKTYRERVEISFSPGSVGGRGVKIADVRWTRRVADGRLVFSAELSRGRGGPDVARVELEVRRAQKRVARTRRSFVVGRRPKHVELSAVLPKPGDYTATVTVSSRDGEELLALPELDVRVEKILSAVPAVSPYTTESRGEIIVRVGGDLRPEECSVAIDGEGFPRREVPLSGPRTVVPFDLAPLENRLYVLDVRLLYQGEVRAETTTRFVKAPPADHVVKIDYRSRGLIVDGKPFFPFGFYTHNGRFYDTYTAELLPDLEAPFKFNLIAPYHNFGWQDRLKFRPQIRRFLDRCWAVGMMVHYDIRLLTDQPISDENWRQIENEILAVKDHPAVLCWYLSDEPAGRKLPPERFINRYRRLKQLDPYHPTTIVFCVPSKAREYSEGFDVLMVDPYPIPNGPVTRVADTVDLVMRDTFGEMPIWCVPQAFGGGEWWGREPTPAEERCMTYLAIVHGATGIQYFIRRPPWNNPFVPQLWGEIRRMAQEIRELTPVLLSDEDKPAVEVIEPAGQVHAAAWAYKGRVVVIAVNTSPQPTPLTLRCTAPPATSQADVLWEQRTVPVSADGHISDVIDGFGVRIYQYRTAPARGLQQTGNLLRNGGFEQQTNVGYPDYFHVRQGKDFAASWGTDSLEAYRGDHSLFIRCPSDGQGPAVISYPMRLGPGKYTATVWLKSDRDGEAKVGVSGFKGAPTQQVGVGRKWQQVSFDFQVPPNTRWVHFYLEALTQGILWADEIWIKPAAEVRR